DLHEVVVPPDEVGVVIVKAGAEVDPGVPSLGRPVDGHDSFQRPWEFLIRGGQPGVQEETLQGGRRYAINPWFARVVTVPTRMLILEWNSEPKTRDSFDVSLGQIVLNVQGYTIRLTMTQTIRIPPEAAPNLILRFGTPDPGALTAVRRFVERELAPVVKSYFLRKAAEYRIQDFVTRYDEVGDDLAEAVRQAVTSTGVQVITTTLGGLEFDQHEINDLRRELVEQTKRAMLEAARLDELKTLRGGEEVRAQIEVQKVKVARERAKLGLVEIRALVELLGPGQVSTERIVRELAETPVPQVIGGNEDVAQQLLSVMPIAQARAMLMTLLDEDPHQSRAVEE
ncbi:MAG: hypothetical protein HOV94_26805, partial [Saccharothrix sp.]|nr:hypothetical protein [Saccharothrix sp.]